MPRHRQAPIFGARHGSLVHVGRVLRVGSGTRPTLTVVLGVGIPTYYLLRMYRLVKTDTLPMHRDVYGFLFSGYEETVGGSNCGTPFS